MRKPRQISAIAMYTDHQYSSRAPAGARKLRDAAGACRKGPETTDRRFRSHARRAGNPQHELTDLKALDEATVHRGADQPGATERSQRANPVCDGEAAECDLGVAVTGEQATAS